MRHTELSLTLTPSIDPTEGSGDTQPPTTSEAAGEAQADSADTEMKDAGEPADAPVVPVNGTPVSTAKKVPNSSAKKKSSGVPEHKSRKLNKKKSKPALNVQAEPGDLYFARMKGHQPWPSIVCDESMLPQPILNSRPVTAALPDGTFKKPEFAPGGKREGERSFPVMFL